MPIEYEMMYLKEMVVDAISKYSEDCYAAGWLEGIENKVLDMIETDPDANRFFKDYQMMAMRELISRGYWVKYDDSPNPSVSGTILYRLNR